MQFPLILNASRHMRNISWVNIFLSLVAPPTFPMGLLSEGLKFALAMMGQSISIIFRTVITQISQTSVSTNTHR